MTSPHVFRANHNATTDQDREQYLTLPLMVIRRRRMPATTAPVFEKRVRFPG